MEMIAASLVMSLIGIFVKLTVGLVTPVYALWFRCLVHLLVLTPFILKQGFSITRKKDAVSRAFCGFLGMSLYFVSLQNMPLTLATSIFWSAPLFTVLFTHLSEGTKMRPKEVISFVLVFLGMITLGLKGGDSGQFEFSFSSLFLCALSSLAIGGSYFYLGKLTRAKEKPLSITFSFSYLMFLFSSPFSLGGKAPEFNIGLLLCLFGVGLSAILYQYLITLSYLKHDADRAAMLQAITIPLVSVLIDGFFYHQSFTLSAGVGIFFLLTAQLLRSFKSLRYVTALLFCYLATTGEAVQAMEARDLRGTWILISYSKISNGVESPWCDRPFGTLSYFSAQQMSVSINCMDPNHPGQVTADPDNMVFYSGSYTFVAPNEIIHHVQNSADPSRIKQDLIRYAELNGKQVILTGLGVKGPFKIVWRKN